MHLSVGDCINVPNFCLLPAPTPFVSDFVVPPTKEEENIFRTLILVLTVWFIITNTKSDDVLVLSPGLKKLGAFPLAYLCFYHYCERDIPWIARWVQEKDQRYMEQSFSKIPQLSLA